MAFSRALLLKGLAGASAVTVGGLGIGYRDSIGNLFRSKEKMEKNRRDWEEVNNRLVTLGLGKECLLGEKEDPSAFFKECDLDDEKIKKINFSNKGKEELKISSDVPDNLKLKMEGSGEGITFYFKGVTSSSPVTILGDKSKGKIVIKGEDQKFRDVNGKLTRENRNPDIEKLNEQLGKVNAPIECRFDEAEEEESLECPISQKAFKTLEFSNKEIKKDLKVSGSLPESIKLKVEKNQDNTISLSFPNQTTELKIYGRKDRGKIVLKSETKFEVENGKLVKGNKDPVIENFNEQLKTVNAPIECRFDEAEKEDSVECGITQDQFKELGFYGKTTTNIVVKNWPESGTVKLKAEKDTSTPNTLSLSFTGLNGDSSNPTTIYREGGKTIIKTGTKFTVVNKQLTKTSGTVDEELVEFNKQLMTVSAPIECRFDVKETDESVECDVSKEQLTTMAFYGGYWWELTDPKADLTGMKLKLLTKKRVDSESGEDKEYKQMILTFEDYKKTVKLMNEKNVVVSFVKGTKPEFGIYDISENNSGEFFLDKTWEPGVFEGALGLECNTKEKKTPIECTFDPETTKIKVGTGTNDQFEELNVTNPNNSKFVVHEDQEDYNQGYKFVFSGTKIPASGGSSVSLEPNSNYELKWKFEDKKPRTVYLVKKG